MVALTGFEPAQSTLAQRTWIMLWLVSGQVYFIFLVMVLELDRALGFSRVVGSLTPFLVVAVATVSLCTVLTSGIGGFVVVAQMIQQDRICIRV